MQLLLIKISALDTNPEYALLGKKQKEDRFIPGNWSRVKSLTRGRRVLLLVPNNEVVLTSVNIPSKNKKQLLQAIPYALEDTLAEDVDNLHFSQHQAPSTNSSQEKNNLTQVAVISRIQLETYQSLLQEHGITAHFILPQLLSQPIENDAWSLQQHDDSFTVRINDFSGFSCDKSLLDIFIEPYDKPETLFSNVPQDHIPKSLQDIGYEQMDSSLVHYKSVVSALPLNLLTNFHSKKGKSSFNWKAWKPTLVLGSLLVTTYLGILGWQNNLLQKEQKQLNSAIESTFKKAFPGSRLVDPAQQMGSKLRQLKKSAGKTINSPLPLISDISPLLKQYKELSLSEIRYQENELIIVVKSPSLNRLEAFKKEAATKANLEIEIKSSTTTADKVEAILIISPLKATSLNNNNLSIASFNISSDNLSSFNEELV